MVLVFKKEHENHRFYLVHFCCWELSFNNQGLTPFPFEWLELSMVSPDQSPFGHSFSFGGKSFESTSSGKNIKIRKKIVVHEKLIFTYFPLHKIRY
jgi:hypothetical protein